jgi:nucleotide-binding universal stress UspA family protein
METTKHSTGPPGSPLRCILLATDLSSASASAETKAIELAVEHEAELLVVNVFDAHGLLLPGGRFRARVDQVRAEREGKASLTVARARAAGVTARFLVWEGEPAEGVLDAADAEDADLIVVGSHGRSRLGRLILGSVSTRVIEHARLPVLVARGDDVVRYEPGTDRGPAAEGGSLDA